MDRMTVAYQLPWMQTSRAAAPEWGALLTGSNRPHFCRWRFTIVVSAFGPKRTSPLADPAAYGAVGLTFVEQPLHA